MLDELGSPVGDSVAFVMDKYGEGISDNANLTAYILSRIETMETVEEEVEEEE